MPRAAYSASLDHFLVAAPDAILGALTRHSDFAVEDTQIGAWLYEIAHLQRVLPQIAYRHPGGAIHFEYAIPRMGRRIDVLLILGGVLFVLEYKVGERQFPAAALDQAVDYALDLKNFHETSHEAVIAPVLIATEASPHVSSRVQDGRGDGVLEVLATNADGLSALISSVLARHASEQIDPAHWQQGRYQPTPTIVEAARALYAGHNVQDIARSDAGAMNLQQTSQRLEEIIAQSRALRRKAICFVTGVPGAGKTLVGLNIATQHIDPNSALYSVFLSGNGPLVNILHEALARDRVARAQQSGKTLRKGAARSEVKAFLQNVHHFRDEGLKDPGAPAEHVVLFDEAQRAWDQAHTVDFMRRKRGIADFSQSEPAFLIACMDRHEDWAVIVCLVGGGQEIHTGEAGIGGWLDAIQEGYPHWQIYASPHLRASEYAADAKLRALADAGRAQLCPELHLAVSMRAFRAEAVSDWVKAVLDGEADRARALFAEFRARYPIVLTRCFDEARVWTREQARGSERYGLVVSSQAQRLKPYAIDVKSPMNPVHWFLNDKQDVRSSYYLEDVATEFQVQGLELDWTCVAWDADFRRSGEGWSHHSFRGDRWQRIRQPHAQTYQRNAYRVLLTRARQGMAIVVPAGDTADPTRDPAYYDETWNYLRAVGIPVL